MDLRGELTRVGATVTIAASVGVAIFWLPRSFQPLPVTLAYIAVPAALAALGALAEPAKKPWLHLATVALAGFAAMQVPSSVFWLPGALLMLAGLARHPRVDARIAGALTGGLLLALTIAPIVDLAMAVADPCTEVHLIPRSQTSDSFTTSPTACPSRVAGRYVEDVLGQGLVMVAAVAMLALARGPRSAAPAMVALVALAATAALLPVSQLGWMAGIAFLGLGLPIVRDLRRVRQAPPSAPPSPA